MDGNFCAQAWWFRDIFRARRSRACHCIFKNGKNARDHSTKIASCGNFVAPLLLPHLARASLMPLLASSSLFHAFPKIQKTLGPFAQKGLRPPAGTLRGPTCSFTCVLQVKLALGLKNHQFLQQLLEGPKRPPGGLQVGPRGHHKFRTHVLNFWAPKRHPKRPPRGPQDPQLSKHAVFKN